MKQKQIEIQNALRVLSHALPKNTTIVFEGGDCVSIPDYNISELFMRTQDAAEFIFYLQKENNK